MQASHSVWSIGASMHDGKCGKAVTSGRRLGQDGVMDGQG